MEVTHNHNAKSQLAKLLASENITVQHSPSAKTAWFDVVKRVLMLPVWREMSNDLYDMLVVHEVGHALDTPADDWMDEIKEIAKRVNGSASSRAVMAVKGFLNVIEDARIDKRQKRRFPGARRNYVKGYAELIDRDFFGTKSKDVNTMSFIDRINIYCKGGAMLGIKFTPEEKALLVRVEAAETFDEVLSLTEEIFAWSKEKHEEQQQETEDFRTKSGFSDDEDEENFGDSDSEYDNDESDDDENSNSGMFDDDGEADETDDEEITDGNSDSEKPDEKSDDPINIGAQNESSDEYIPESETEKFWQERQSELIKNSDDEYVYVKIPRPVRYDTVVHDYKIVMADQKPLVANYGADWLQSVRTSLQKFKSDENASISFMVKEFEMRKSADEYSRTSLSKTGVIDTNKLHSYKYNDDLFRRITNVATGKNHGFVMFIDWSASMDVNLGKTIKQLISFTMFCRRVQIPFEVYSFRNAMEFDSRKGRLPIPYLFTRNEKELEFDNMVARNLLSSRMSAQEYNDALFNLFVAAHGVRVDSDKLGSTPLNECIGVADLIVNRFKARSKVQIVNTIFLTDGESDPINSVHGIAYSGKKRKYILQDEITKKTYDIRGNNRYGYDYSPYYSREMTSLLLRVLKDRVGGNLIGFFITNEGVSRACRDVSGNEPDATMQKEWRENGFFGLKSVGYDEYYIINAKTFNVSSGNLKVDSNMTKRKIASEFIKFSEKKSVSRVLLSRFVKRIAA
jgi:hypothetical protein